MCVWLPLKAAQNLDSSRYTIIMDFDPNETLQPLQRSTVIDVETGGEIECAKLISVFPGELWFRMTSGDNAIPTGDLILSMNFSVVNRLGHGASVLVDELATFFVYEQVTLQRSVWLTAFAGNLTKAKSKLQKPKGGSAKQLKDMTLAQILDLFLEGGLSISVDGGITLPTVDPAEDLARFAFSMCAVSWPDTADRQKNLPDVSAGAMVDWAMDPANLTVPIYEYPFCHAIPIGYFYQSICKDDFGSSNQVEHPLLAAIVGDPCGWANSPFQRLRDFISGYPKWRCFAMVTQHTPRSKPALWSGWEQYRLEVDDVNSAITLTGRAFFKKADRNVQCRLLRGTSPVGIRRPFVDNEEFKFALSVQLGTDTHSITLVADTPEPSYLVTRVTSSSALVEEYSDHTAPSDLRGLAGDTSYRFKVYALCENKISFVICPGKHPDKGCHFVRHTSESCGWGIEEDGTIKPAEVLAAYDLGWSPAQKAVLKAVAENEGRIDAINTWDDAFLSTGMLQWTIFTKTNKTGELAGFLAFLDAKAPSIFREYFGRHKLTYSKSDLKVDPKDRIPRGFLCIGETVLNDSAAKDVIREYKWAQLFRVASQDPDYQLIQLRYAFERLKIMRDEPLRLSDNKVHKIGALFTSQYSVALLADQHTNRPGNVAENILSLIGAVGAHAPMDEGKAFSQNDLDAIIALYKGGKRQMTAGEEEPRRNRIDAALLDRKVDSFDWPTEPANDWLS